MTDRAERSEPAADRRSRDRRQDRGRVRGRLLALVTALFLVWGAVAAPAASAHATVVSTDPADGALLPAAPDHVTITFSEDVELQLGAIRVFGPDGSRADEGSAAHAPGKGDTATIQLRTGLKNGTYLVSWRVVSADSHPVHGGFTFSVGSASAVNAAGSAAESVSGNKAVGIAYGVARWLAYLGFAVLAGTAFLLIAFAPRLTRDRRIRRLLAGGWFTLLFGTIAALLLQGPYASGLGLGDTFDTEVLQATLHTRLGKALAYRLILLGAAGAMVSWIATRLATAPVRIRQVVGGTGIVLALALALTWSAADHAGTGDQVALALPADVLHLLAMAAWVGGLTAVCAVVLRGSAEDDLSAGLDLPGREKVVRRFSTVAFTAVSVLAATGVYQAWRQVRTVDALVNTSYGRLVLIKSMLFVVLLGLGYVARRLLAGKTPDLRTLRKSVAAEFGIALAVLAVTALLVESQPAKTENAGPVSVTMPFDTGAKGGAGTVNVVVDPARAGTDTLHVYVLDANGQAESVPEVTASLSLPSQQIGPLPVKLDNAGPGHYVSGTATFPVGGSWQIIVTVRTTDIDQATVILNADVR